MKGVEVKEVIAQIHCLCNNRDALCKYVCTLDVGVCEALLRVLRQCSSHVNVGQVLRALCLDDRFVVKALVAIGVGISGKRGTEREALLGVVGGVCGGREDVVGEVVREGLGGGVGVVEVLCEIVRGIKDGARGRFWALVVVRGVKEGWWGAIGGSWREVLSILGMKAWLGDVGEIWVMDLVKVICGRIRGGIEVVELVGRIMERIDKDRRWVAILRWVFGDARATVFADVLCVLELEIADRRSISHALVKEYEKLLRFAPAEGDGNERENDHIFGCKDVALLISIMRICPDESVKKGASRCLTSLLGADPSLIDVSDVASGSSSAAEQKCPPFALMRGFLMLPGMEQRVSTFTYFCEQLICSKDEALVDWGVRLWTECFLRFENVRLDLINRSFSATVEQDRPLKDRAGFCKLLSLLLSGAHVHVLRAHASDIGQWLSFVTLVPLALATSLTTSLANFANCCPTFRDLFMNWLRKLTFCKTYAGHQIVATGLCTLLSTLDEGSEACEEILTSLLDLIDSSTIPLRANILLRIRPFLCKHLRLRDTISNRLGRMSDGPFRLNSCIAVEDHSVRVVDAVPALIRSLVVIRNMSSAEQGYFHYNAARNHLNALVDYVLNPSAALFHAIYNGGRKLSLQTALKASILKLSLLLSICETLVEPAKESRKLSAMIRIYAITSIVRSAIQSFAKQNGYTSSRVESQSLAKKELMTAREAANVDWSDPQSMFTSVQNPETDIEIQSVKNLLSSENEYILVRCASASEALSKLSSTEVLHSSTRTNIVSACLCLFRDTHPWATSGGSQRLSPETTDVHQSGSKKIGSENIQKVREENRSVNEPTDSSGVPASSIAGDACAPDLGTGQELPSELTIVKEARSREGPRSDMVNISCVSAPLEEEENDRGACFRHAAISLVRTFGSTSLFDEDMKIAGVAISSLLSKKTADTDVSLPKGIHTPESTSKRHGVSALSSSSSTTSVKPSAIAALPPFPSKLSSSLDRDQVLGTCRIATLHTLSRLKSDLPLHGTRWASLFEEGVSSTNSQYTPLLQCFKKDFEYSMSLALALKYCQLLSAMTGDSMDVPESGFPEIANAICEVLNSFEVRQVTLLRCLIAVVLKILPREECKFLVLAIGRMVTYPTVRRRRSDDEDISLDVDSLPPDILRAGLIMDGVLPGNDASSFLEAHQSGKASKVWSGKDIPRVDSLAINVSVIQGWTGEVAASVLNSVVLHLHDMMLRPNIGTISLATEFLQHLYDNEGCDVGMTFGQSAVQNLVSRILSEGKKAMNREGDEVGEEIAAECCRFAGGKIAKMCVSQNPRLTLRREMLAVSRSYEDDRFEEGGVNSTQNENSLPAKRRRGRVQRRGARVLRSRNRVIDEWLSKDAHDDDDFADLENFVVDVEDDE